MILMLAIMFQLFGGMLSFVARRDGTPLQVFDVVLFVFVFLTIQALFMSIVAGILESEKGRVRS